MFFQKKFGFKLAGNYVISCKKCNQEKADRWPTLNEIERACQIYDLVRDVGPVYLAGFMPVKKQDQFIDDYGKNLLAQVRKAFCSN